MLQNMFLIVTNPGSLEKGSLPKSRFDDSGGTIGSHENNHWRLTNYANSVQGVHCEIVVINKQFCLVDRCGDTYINSSHKPLGINSVVALKSGDHLRIESYIIRVEYLGDCFSGGGGISIEDLFHTNSNKLLDSTRPKDSLLNIKKEDTQGFLLTTKNSVVLDPLLAFNDLKSSEDEVDFLIPIEDLGLSERSVSGADNSATTVEAIGFSKQYFVEKMKDKG
jgi:type VI secretion system protein ImpI